MNGEAAAPSIDAPAAAHTLAAVLRCPLQVEKPAPCSAGCATGVDVRGWIAIIAQGHKLGLTNEEAYARAFGVVTAVNPFPATLGRICPHPCEALCSRAGKDGAVAINALERFLGDWGLEQGLRLPALDEGPHPESIGVIGAGPAGLSFAYQMARRGYAVTIYEKEEAAGGMLQHGIPEYRLPGSVLAREVARLADFGVELRLNTAVGRDIAVQEVSSRHVAIFLGIGASCGLRLGIPGEDGRGVWTGVDYLAARNRGEAVALGNNAVVIGGGNTAIEAARTALRAGVRVTILYRRTAAEMLAFAREVAEALAEGVAIEYLAAPVAITRGDGVVNAVIAQRMQLGVADASGRRRATPIAGSDFVVPAESVITAVSQVPDLGHLEGLLGHNVDAHDFVPQGSFALLGGDVLGPGIAGRAIAQGRQAAEELHAKLRRLDAPREAAPRDAARVKPDCYAPKARVAVPELAVAARLANPDAEVAATISEEQFVGEAERCFSCGSCFGCERCFTYCNPGSFTRLSQPGPGAYFALTLDRCEGCRKCVEVCPCDCLSVATDASVAGTLSR